MTEFGSFLYIHGSKWLKRPEERRKRKGNSVNPNPIIDDFHFEYILKKGGWDILRSSLAIERNSRGFIEVKGIKMPGKIMLTE
mmetsp:Transcript_5809/g.5036  ORF Transcript_5809/g.5036 Transcript_5809/m.5036 type:complete len:83 (+) Transcript_5809:310-558(+)